ncbi:MAG: ABC transporter ATP-binding protein [Clostridia bacterium]|nr:ABC transporter ATP-binding protein [Clostridia bacterium]
MKNNSSLNTIKKVIKVISKHGFFIFLSLTFAVLSVVLTLYVPILAGNAIDLIIAKGRVDFSGIKDILIKAAICIAASAVLQWLMNLINNKITYNTIRDIRKQAFKNIQQLPLSFIDSHAHGDIVSRVTADADQLADGLLLGFSQLFSGVVTILVTLIFMLTVNPLIAAAVVILTPLSLFAAKFIAKHTYDMFALQSKTRGEETAYINEIIGNQKIVKAYSKEENCKQKFGEINGKLEKYSLKAVFFSSLTNPTTRFINAVIYAVVALLGALFTIAGGITVGGLTCFLSYANQYTKPFNEISGVITELQNALACAERIFEVIEQSKESDDLNCKEISTADTVKIENVSFSYTKNTSLIENFNLEAKKGDKIAIVGPTGCGKTTLINLIIRFYDVNSGKISIDDTDIRDIKRQSLRRQYGMVLQETWLKNATVKENISFGKPDASEEEIIAAAKATNAHGFIKRLKNGYDTVIGDDGANLSEGERQLLCITRVMLCSPPMLILDEATSSIDTRTELKVGEAFDKLMKGKTAFIVAHRLSTIKNADIILVMKDGKIIEQGKHTELIKKGGFYKTLYDSQFAV